MDEFWPEVDIYYKLSDYARLYAIATYTFAEDDTQDNEQYGLNVDVFVKPVRALQRLRGADALAADRKRRLQLRLGYRYANDFNSPTPSVVNRLLAELTARMVTKHFSLADRNGIDARWKEGVYSSRYRNRIYLEVPANLKHYAFTPYADVEWTYVITDDEWNNVRYEAGAQLPVVSHFTVEAYFGWQTYWESTPSYTRGPGMNLVFSF